MILECCSKSLLCVCHLPTRTWVPVQGDLEFPRSLPIPGMLRQTLSCWCLSTGLGQGWEGREGAFPAGDTRSKQDLCATECQLGFVPLRGVSRMLFQRDVQRLLRGLTPTRGATVKREPGNSQHHQDLLLGSSSSPCHGNDPAGTRMELCNPALGSWLPQGHRDEASGHPTRILLSASRCQRGENQNHPEMLCWATRGVVSQPWFPHPVRGRSCSSPSPWMDLSVGSLKTRKKSQFSAPLEPLRVLILLLWVLLPRSWWGCAVPWAIPGLGFPSTSWEWSAAVGRGHIPFLGGKLLG